MNDDKVFDVLKYRIYNARIKAYAWLNNAGKTHRDGGPALEFDNGTKMWFYDGLLHRTDGPAVEYADGGKFWYIYGGYLSEEEFNQRTKL